MTSQRRRARPLLPRMLPWRAAFSAALLALPLALLLGLPISTRPAGAQANVPNNFVDQLIMGNLRQPVGMTFLPDGRLLVVEQAGGIRMIVEGKLAGIDPVATVDSVLITGEQGLTGVAVDYRWPAQPYVYVYYDAVGDHCRLSRFRAVGDLNSPTSGNLALDPASRYDLLRDIPDLTFTHNGGTIRFGKDHMLYVGLGEDAYACGSQDTTSLRGVMLRLTVENLPDGPGGPADKALMVPADNPWASATNANQRLVWATGLRNPFRFHIDPLTGALFIADVGWNLYEEINIADGTLLNFGWPYYEGPAPYVSSCPGLTMGSGFRGPIYAYDRSGFTAAAISGGVYRPAGCPTCSFPAEYNGDYFFSDYYEGFLRRLHFTEGVWELAAPVPGQPNGNDWATGFRQVSDYQVGPDGALWYCRMAYDFEDDTGEIRRIYYEPVITAVSEGPMRGLDLAAPFPSPSHGSSRLSYRLPRTARVELAIFDAQGRRVRSLVPAGTQGAGEHHVVWDGRLESGSAASSGLYMIRLSANGVVRERRLPLVR